MRKDNIRDYTVAAFRFYTRVGGYDKYRLKLQNDVVQRQKQRAISVNTGSVGNPTEATMIMFEMRYAVESANLLDLDAVEKTKYLLSQTTTYLNGSDIWQAMELVYMAC